MFHSLLFEFVAGYGFSASVNNLLRKISVTFVTVFTPVTYLLHMKFPNY